jgi:tetratricopeptide (TPR) repeat protein
LDATAAQVALTHFEVALNSSSNGAADAWMGRILWGHARAQGAVLGSDQMQVAFDTLVKAYDLYAADGDYATACEIAGHPLGLQRGVRGWVNLAEQALKLVEPDSAAAGRILVRQAVDYWYAQGNAEQADACVQRALAISTAHSDTGLELEAVAALAIVAGLTTEDEALRGLHAARRALELAASNRDPMTEVRAGIQATARSSLLGRVPEAVVHGVEAAEVANRTGSASSIAAVNLFLARALIASGDWEEAESAIARVDVSVEGDQSLSAASLRTLAGYEQGLLSDLDDLIEQASALNDTELLETSWPGLSAAVAERILPDPGTRQFLQERIQLFRDKRDVEQYGGFNTLVARVAIGMDAATRRDVDSAREAYNDLNSASHLMPFVTVDRVLGLLAQVIADVESAVGHFEDALAFCRDGGCRPELAWTCSDYAEMLIDRAAADPSSASGIADHERAIELQDEALTITRELGMRPLTERILARREILRA